VIDDPFFFFPRRINSPIVNARVKAPPDSRIKWCLLPEMLFTVVAFMYSWQMAGVVHLFGHKAAATVWGVKAEVIVPWQRFVPLLGWGWNLVQPHGVMMCHYDNAALSRASPACRVSVGFGGPYTQLIYMIVVGTVLLPEISVMVGGRAVYSLIMCIWQFLYFFFYAIHFHADPHSDFVLFSRLSKKTTE
jgi:hypothetical protein